MGLEVVVEEIREIGQKEATAIRNEANEEARRILAAAEERATSIKQEAEAEVERQVQQMEAQEASAAKLLVRREVLNAQKELLQDVFKATEESISALPDTFHEKAIRELLKKVAKEIKDGVVFSNSRDQKAVESALSELKTLSGYSYGGIVEISGGVVVKSADGQLTVDLSYQTFLDEVWESGLKDASDILFG
ncbi:MAG: V-type ATP synthase subunit E [Methanomicrobiales archaeon 53_19]|uniref:V-type ATP synthase subunit E family protein n=1 Tax=Methanocalculus sp. TaxID=2004547 RepID=UPI00074A8A80|nr:V-type ATP synthase subunit E family protein [Methanocalculus sp.]KUK68186.1 MAG: V-type ATP synthase subunit E [Methanocalculus sp. 52_23]KUL03883.1 MAG: V-type ATP synthase subunit E [Methanomicrobiales archaeon 53_19]HIJ06571.1 V-type ATP synthase subunit E [Methanocalculus sp.]